MSEIKKSGVLKDETKHAIRMTELIPNNRECTKEDIKKYMDKRKKMMDLEKKIENEDKKIIKKD
jgi:hypothetical protein